MLPLPCSLSAGLAALRPAATLTALALLIACDGGDGRSLAGEWQATLVQGEEFPNVIDIEVGGVVQGPQTRTATLTLYEDGKGDLLFKTVFVSMLSKTENVSYGYYDARVTVDEDPNFTIRLFQDSFVSTLECTRSGDLLECEQEINENADPNEALWDFTRAEDS
ncbi:MAG: hypothetical protein H6713_12915 [Myxococcales bacterium]|nr:hypothetical protein [Myxococcales bacterium]